MILSSRSVKPTPMSTPVNGEDAKQKSGEREAPRQFRTLDAADHDVTWSLDDATVAREGSPLGLAVALATVAAYTGVTIDPGVVVAGGAGSAPFLTVTI